MRQTKTDLSSTEGSGVQQTATQEQVKAPLTATQLGMIYESLGSGQPWINLEQILLRFDQNFPLPEPLQAGWQQVCARHDALRLRLMWQKVETPHQLLTSIDEVALAQLDWSSRASMEQEALLRDFLAEDRNAGMDPQHSPGWRLTHIRTGVDSGYLLLTVHHALLDGRSIAKVVSDLLWYLDSGQLPDGEPARAFTDVVTEISTLSQSAAAEDYFSDYLQDFDSIGALTLPVTPSDEADRKDSLVLHCSSDLMQDLRDQSARLDVTVANLVQAAWGLVLLRWQGREEMSIGTVRSGRHAVAQSQDAVGCLINTLPLRIKATRTATLKDIAQTLRQDTLALHAHEQVTPGELRQWGGISGQSPLFSTLVMFERGTMQQLVHAQAPARLRPTITLLEEGGLPLTLAVYASNDGGAKIMLEYDPVHVPADLAQKLLKHFETLLPSLAQAHADTPLAALDMMQADERHTLKALAEPENAVGDAPFDLLAKFEETVAARADICALKMLGSSDTLTYKDLCRRSNGLAHVLRDAGVGANDVVAISLPRSIDFIVAIFATLKAGARFVPVDPTYPAANQAHMIQDSGAKVILSYDSLAEAAADTPVLSPNAQPADIAPNVMQGEGAYIIYTSGSTGTPKGVEVSRGNLTAHIAAVTPTLALTRDDRVLQFASLSFDVALEEIFPTLLAGATLLLRSDEMAQSPAHFREVLAEERITLANIPTAFWTVFTDYLASSGHGIHAELRMMVVGGELVKPKALRKWQTLAPNVRWLNGYGPTETTITCTLYEALSPQNPNEEVPIGRPTGHARAYVLAADGSLAPHGAVGELSIGGAAVTQGYLGLPDKSDDVFIQHAKLGRIYRSGDHAQWGCDGQLRFLGRRDRQVKLRGFRIDLRQVERAVEEAAEGAEVVTAIRNQGTPAAQLISWIKAPDGLSQIKSRTEALLPAHMRPTLVLVEDFPTTAGGKIDMKSLPDPVEETTTAGLSGGETRIEQLVQEIMAKVLGRKSVGVNDSFYDLGGHSLLAVELIGKLESATGGKLGIMDLKNHPTCRELARILETGSNAPKHIVPIQPNGSRPPLFAIHILGARESYFEPMARYLGPDQPIMGVSVGSLDENTPTGIEFTARRYCLDIMEYYPEGPINLMAVSLGAYMAFELARQLRAAGREVALLALFDAAGPGGREEHQGLRRLWCHLRRAKYLGWAYPAQIIRNRIHNLRNTIARAQIQKAESEGEGQATAPMTVFEFIASNELAVQAYTASPIEVPITIFRAESHFFDTDAGIAAGLGWETVAAAGHKVIDVPGGHLTMLEDPYAATLALRFSELLEEQQRNLLERSRDDLVAEQALSVAR